MKRKFLLPIIATCMAVAIVGVGYAAWLITGSNTDDTAQGSFVAYEVSNNYYTVTIDPVVPQEETDTTENPYVPKIVFGYPKSENQSGQQSQVDQSNSWLKYDTVGDNAVAEEKLTATFTVTIDPDVDFATGRTVETLLGANNVVKVTLYGYDMMTGYNSNTDRATSTLYQTCVTGTGTTGTTGQSYLAWPTITATYRNTSNQQDITVSSDKTTTNPNLGTKGENGKVSGGITIELPAAAFAVQSGNQIATCTITVKFDWGTLTNSTNPYTHYNGDTFGYSKKSAEEQRAARTEAQTMLEKVHELAQAKYALVLSVGQATPAAPAA